MTTLVIGERGEGKTTLALWLATCLSRVVLMFEPKFDETVQREEIHGHKIIPVYNDAEMFDAIQEVIASGAAAVIMFIPGDDVEEGFFEFCDVIESGDPRVRYLYGGITIVIDEGWTLMSPNKSHPKLELLLRVAPRNGASQINVIVLAHKPVDINQRTHTFSEELFVFRLSEQSDIERIRERWRPEVADAVAKFPDGEHYVARYDKNSRELQIWSDCQVWGPEGNKVTPTATT